MTIKEKNTVSRYEFWKQPPKEPLNQTDRSLGCSACGACGIGGCGGYNLGSSIDDE